MNAETPAQALLKVNMITLLQVHPICILGREQ